MSSLECTIHLEEPSSCDYLFIDEDNIVHLLMPIARGETIGLDNTCKMVLELQTFLYGKNAQESALTQLRGYRRKLEADWNTLHLAERNLEAELRAYRLDQINDYISKLEALLIDKRIEGEIGHGNYPNYPREIKTLIHRSRDLFPIQLSTAQPDEMIKNEAPVFSLIARKPSLFGFLGSPGEGWERVVAHWAKTGSLGEELRKARLVNTKPPEVLNLIVEQSIQKLNDECKQKVFSLQENPLERTSQLMNALEEIANSLVTQKKLITRDEETISESLNFKQNYFDGSALCFDSLGLYLGLDERASVKEVAEGILKLAYREEFWSALKLAEHQDLNSQVFASYFVESDPEVFSIKVQFFLAQLNIYCQLNTLSDLNFGEALDKAPHSQKLVTVINEAIESGEPIAEAILTFVNDHQRVLELTEPLNEGDLEIIKQSCALEFKQIESTQHFDDFLIKRDSEEGLFYVHRNRICLNFANFIDEWNASLSSHHLKHSQRALARRIHTGPLSSENSITTTVIMNAEQDYIPSSQLNRLSTEQIRAQLNLRLLKISENKEWIITALCHLHDNHLAEFNHWVNEFIQSNNTRTQNVLFKHIKNLLLTDDFSDEKLSCYLKVIYKLGEASLFLSLLREEKNTSQNLGTYLISRYPNSIDLLHLITSELSTIEREELKRSLFTDYQLEPEELARLINLISSHIASDFVPFVENALKSFTSIEQFYSFVSLLSAEKLEIFQSLYEDFSLSLIHSYNDLIRLLPYLSRRQLEQSYQQYKEDVKTSIKSVSELFSAAYYFGPQVIEELKEHLCVLENIQGHSSNFFILTESQLDTICDEIELSDLIHSPEVLENIFSELSPGLCERLAARLSEHNTFSTLFDSADSLICFINTIPANKLNKIMPSLIGNKQVIDTLIHPMGWENFIKSLDKNLNKTSFYLSMKIIFSTINSLPFTESVDECLEMARELTLKEELVKSMVAAQKTSKLITSEESLIHYIQQLELLEFPILFNPLCADQKINDFLRKPEHLSKLLSQLAEEQRYALMLSLSFDLITHLSECDREELEPINALLNGELSQIFQYLRVYDPLFHTFPLEQRRLLISKMSHCPNQLKSGEDAYGFLKQFLDESDPVEHSVLTHLPGIYFNSHEKVNKIVKASLATKFNALSFAIEVNRPKSPLYQALNLKSTLCGLYLPTFWLSASQVFDFKHARPLLSAQLAADEQLNEQVKQKKLL